MINVPQNVTPGFELHRIRKLAEDLDSPDPALKFLADFFSMLPRRVDRILHGLQEQDTEIPMDALTSLRVTSAMTGARMTEAWCHAIEEHVRRNRFDKAIEATAVLHAGVTDLIAAGPDVLREAHSMLLPEPRS
jgi:hypothetical protein